MNTAHENLVDYLVNLATDLSAQTDQSTSMKKFALSEHDMLALNAKDSLQLRSYLASSDNLRFADNFTLTNLSQDLLNTNFADIHTTFADLHAGFSADKFAV